MPPENVFQVCFGGPHTVSGVFGCLGYIYIYLFNEKHIYIYIIYIYLHKQDLCLQLRGPIPVMLTGVA